MIRIFYLITLLIALFLSSCSLNNSLNPKPDEARIINAPKKLTKEKQTKNAVTFNDPEKLYQEKQYDKALLAILESDAKLLEDPSARKLLWSINDRLVTVQWFLQKSIIELLKGHKDKARKHLNDVLQLYPGHMPSLLLKQRLDSINLKENHKIPKSSRKKDKKNKNTVKEDTNLAEYYLLVGNAYLEDDQLTLAKAYWLQGLDIAPSHKDIQENLINLFTNEGLQLFGQGNIKASIEKWEEALKIKPNDPEIKGYLDKARKAEEKVRSID